MSLGILVKGTEGLVLAAESRVTLTVTPPPPQPQPQAQVQSFTVNYDNATKLLTFSSPNRWIGAVTYGQAVIGLRPAHSFLSEFEQSLPEGRLAVQDFSERLSNFFLQQWQAAAPPVGTLDMTFVVGGFDEGQPYGSVYTFDIPRTPTPSQRSPGEDFGITWGGQRDFVDRLLQGFDTRLLDLVTSTLGLQAHQVQDLKIACEQLRMQIPLQVLGLQDCVDLALFFIRTTIDAQKLTVGIRGCGGPIDVAIITRNGGLQFVQRKQITGENPPILPLEGHNP